MFHSSVQRMPIISISHILITQKSNDMTKTDSLELYTHHAGPRENDLGN